MFVKDASSRAVKRPMAVTNKADSFSKGGIVIVGIFRGKIEEVIKRPARMLPHASRLMGFNTAGLFSLIGERGKNRGWPMDTKYTTRML